MASIETGKISERFGSYRIGSNILMDRYRCSEDCLPPVFLSGSLAGPSGYFRFGEAICFGQSTSGRISASVGERLIDVLHDVAVEESGLGLPFDPAQVVDNLRAERYCAETRGLRSWPTGGLLGHGYYLLRPLMPISIRKHLQKMYFLGWRDIKFPQWPVDFTVEQIHERLMFLALKARSGKPVPFIWFWPDGFSSCTIMTHDVETQAGVDMCPRLMDINDSFHIKSSFQVVPEERYMVREDFLSEIRQRGFEVNVHDLNHDGHLFRDRDEFVRRAALINQYILEFGALGFRSAVMYRNVDWYDALNVEYDMSVPNVAHLDPQQGGCCTVLPFFIGDIIELPVTMTQDYSLFHILGKYATEVWFDQIERIRQKHGLISAIVHPDYIITEKPQQVYKDLLRRLATLRDDRATWSALPREVARWWRLRSRMKLRPNGNSWRVEGEGSEHARLAYASLDGESLRYECVAE